MNLTPMLSELSGQVDGRLLMTHLAEFARWTKHAGTPTELASLNYVRTTFESYGYKTELILHDAYISLPGAAHIEVAGERFVCITQSFSRSSPPGGLRGTTIAAGWPEPGWKRRLICSHSPRSASPCVTITARRSFSLH